MHHCRRLCSAQTLPTMGLINNNHLWYTARRQVRQVTNVVRHLPILHTYLERCMLSLYTSNPWRKVKMAQKEDSTANVINQV